MKPRILVTRPAAQAGDLSRALEAAGFEPVPLPLLEVVPPADPKPLDAALSRLDRFDWVAVTSANAVPPLARHENENGWPRRTLVAAVGQATRAALQDAGLPVSLVPTDPQAKGLVEALEGRVRDLSVLLPQAADARPTLVEGLAAAGALVTAVVAYDKRQPPDAAGRAREIWREAPPAWATVTSPRVGRHLLTLLDDLRLPAPRLVSIGPVTSAALRELGAPPDAEAAEPSTDGLATAVRAAHGTAFQ